MAAPLSDGGGPAATPEPAPGRREPGQSPPPGLIPLLESEQRPLVSDRVLLILTLALAAAFVLTALISWWVWHTPAMVPVHLESVPRA